MVEINVSDMAKSLAYDLYNDLQNCISDMAEDDVSADMMFDDAGVISDVLGDSVFDACNCKRTPEDEKLYLEVLTALTTIGHDVVQQVVSKWLERETV